MQPDSTPKTCSICKELKPLSVFGKSRRAKDGLRAECKPCYNAYMRAWKMAHPETGADWRRTHSETWKASNAAYRLAHAEEHRAHNTAYRQTHPERVSAAAALRYQANPEKLRRWNAARHLAHPEIAREYKHRRKVSLLGRPTERISMAKLVARDSNQCGICGKGPDAKPWSIDHILPVSKGGTHTYANVRITHLRGNIARGNRKPAQLRMIG